MFAKTMVILLAGGLAGFAQGVDPKGIFISPGNGGDSRPAVKYGIRLNRDGEAKPVAASYRFRSGDRFQFQFELNQPGYVYLLHREMTGDPDTMERYVGAKGIVIVRDDDNGHPPSSKYQLLWPSGGDNVKLTARQSQTVPARGDYFQFDNTPGLEKIVMVVSPKPLDIEREFPGVDSPQRGNANRRRNDSEGDVLGQLKKSLDALEANAAVAPGASEKGICVGDCDSYSAPRNPSDPFMQVIDLRHFR